MKGIDVSTFQGATFDWAAAKAAGVTFASYGGVTSIVRPWPTHPDPEIQAEISRYREANARGDRLACLETHGRLRELYAAYAGRTSHD